MKHPDFTKLVFVITPIFLVIFIVIATLYISKNEQRHIDMQKYFATQIASTTQALTTAETRLSEVDTAILASISSIDQNLSITKEQSKAITEAIEKTISEEKEKVANLTEETEKIGGSVGTLEKLSQTDPELLQKYSKVFFLNEHYVPSGLSEIRNGYLYSERETQYIHKDVIGYLTKMIDAALLDEEKLYVKSAYRSFNQQDSLKDTYSVLYGKDLANQFSADQGYSEHQLGTTLDIITIGLNGSLDDFGNTTAYTWLQNNAYKYGFILSYPEDNTYYVYEPWHWRFVGVALATKLHTDEKFFYDLEQREIDKYLVSIFD